MSPPITRCWLGEREIKKNIVSKNSGFHFGVNDN